MHDGIGPTQPTADKSNPNNLAAIGSARFFTYAARNVFPDMVEATLWSSSPPPTTLPVVYDEQYLMTWLDLGLS